MTIGPGKYDEICTVVREETQAAAAIVIIFGGIAGNGFSCQADLETTARLPDILEEMAAQIRADANAKRGN